MVHTIHDVLATTKAAYALAEQDLPTTITINCGQLEYVVSELCDVAIRVTFDPATGTITEYVDGVATFAGSELSAYGSYLTAVLLDNAE